MRRMAARECRACIMVVRMNKEKQLPFAGNCGGVERPIGFESWLTHESGERVKINAKHDRRGPRLRLQIVGRGCRPRLERAVDPAI